MHQVDSIKMAITLIEVENLALDFYLKSGDFNGMSLANLSTSLGIEFEELREIILEGIGSDRLRIISSDHELNPHVIREGFRDKEFQVNSLRSDNSHHTCVYPSIAALNDSLSEDECRGRPFERMLAEGQGQLEIVFFDLELLEFYRNDPRYYYECNDIGGRICIEDEHYESENMEEKDKVLLKAFGLAYDEDFNRYLAAFIGDVADLSPEHQNIWQAKHLTRPLKVHPDFYGSQILGRWPTHISIFDAVLHEQRIINAMARNIGKTSLFKNEFGRYLEEKPKEFAFMLRPTIHEYESFIHLLDKLMSDNINKKFFKGDIDLESETVRKDGKIQVTQKGTISLLDEWLRKHYRTSDWEPWNFAISVFRNIRKQRQSPAHSVNVNKYDQSLIEKQRDLMQEVCEALMILRHALRNHPACKDHDFEIPKALEERKIWVV
jgi:hypothetical protein